MASLQRFMGLGKSPAYDSALACYEEERYSDAIPLFETALRECHDPTVQKLARAYLAESYAKLGYRRINKGDWERAYAYFTMATDYAPQYADWWFQAGYAAYRQEQYENALRALQQATQVNPSFAGTVPDGTNAVRLRRARAGADHLTAVGSATGRHPRDIR